MRCPRCSFQGEPVRGACPNCGYGLANVASLTSSYVAGPRSPVALQNPLAPGALPVYALMRGDVLRQGRYRLVEQIQLPDNQRDQGVAWLAMDSRLSNNRVVIRSITHPGGLKEDIIHSIIMRFIELGQHRGFPEVIDTFTEHGIYYMVLQRVEGDSLAVLLQRYGGALPEPIVAEYGWQVCELLSLLEAMRPPMVHGSINPDTLIVSPDGGQVSLIHLPLFTPREPDPEKASLSPGYLAPEQVRGSIEPSSDLYSLAATMHRAVTGFDPRERMAFFFPPARRLNPAVTPQMEAILSRQLRLSVAQRYAHPSDMQKDLSALIASYPAMDETPAPAGQLLAIDTSKLQEVSRERTLLDIGIFAAVGVLILIALLFAILHP